MTDHTILIFRSALLAGSETFITAQGEAMRHHTAWYCGVYPVPGIETPRARTTLVTASQRRLARALAIRAVARSGRTLDRGLGFEPALVHAHFGPDAGLLLPYLARRGTPLVVTHHGYDVFTDDSALRRGAYNDRLYIRRRAAMWDRASVIIAVSDAVRRRLTVAGAPAEKVVLHYIGVDTSGSGTSGRRTGAPPTVVYVGRLVKLKGVEILLRAMVKVQATVPDARLLVVGDGAERGRLERLARVHRLRVQFLGHQPRERVREVLRQGDVLCAPSQRSPDGWQEAFGLVMAEAMAESIPVVASRIGGIAEVVEDGVTGILCEAGDAAAFGDALSDLLLDPRRAVVLGAEGRRRVTSRFDLRKQTAALERLYITLTGAASSTASVR